MKLKTRPEFWDEMAETAPRAWRITCIVVMIALLLAISADVDNLKPEFRNTGLLLRLISFSFFFFTLPLTWLFPALIRKRYQLMLTIMIYIINIPVALVGSHCGEKGLLYFAGIVEVNFAAATFLTLRPTRYLPGLILTNIFFPVAWVAIGGNPPDQVFVNIIVTLAIFAVVTFATYIVILEYKVRSFEQRRELREKGERISEILESITDAFISLDSDHRLVYINREARNFFSRDHKSLAELQGRIIWDLYPNLVGDSRLHSECLTVMQSGKAVSFEEFYPRFGGDFEVHVYPARNGLSVYFNEITERKENERRIEKSLAEKEVLLRHIHHGVKNNLQTITSLLNLQSNLMENPDAIAALDQSRNRIQTMALVHEKLYQSEDLSSIDLAEFTNSLSGYMFDACGVGTDRVGLEIDMDRIRLPVDTAIPCGLIINELISNSLKHGFPSGKEGSIRISLKPLEEHDYVLEVSDNGIGLNGKSQEEKVTSLGLQLVRILSEKQLAGKMSVRGDTGFAVTIRFNPKIVQPSAN